MPMYDLVIKGGTVIDPSQGINRVSDVAVTDGKIARIAASIPVTEARRTVEVKGKIVCPGLIDLHTHVYQGVNGNGVKADVGGVHAGVTTMVDAGSSGCDTFGGFPNHIIPNNKTEIMCFLHICRTGLATTPDIFSRESIDLDKTIQVASENKGIIHGIKARMVSPALEIFGMEMPRLAKRAAREAGVKLMVHIGDTEKRYDPSVIRQLLPIMDEGDIITHLFTANPGGVLDGRGKLVPEAKEAQERGVWLDTAHGRGNFAFDVGAKVLDQGLVPHCISTDLTLPGRQRTVHSMTEMLTRFLALGFTLEQVIAMSTINPAKALGAEDRLGTLGVGRQADISVLDVKDGDWVVYDVIQGARKTDKAVVPVLTVKRGEVFEVGWGPRPWGWEPDQA
ncbi:MAG: amidohydrolase/deacetylase family metallohydrolase [Dehalococcoidia bacterium]|nr:amidohydrolase/deacetylase family metallohydrolase [Dehalococcoidia bacterium]